MHQFPGNKIKTYQIIINIGNTGIFLLPGLSPAAAGTLWAAKNA